MGILKNSKKVIDLVLIGMIAAINCALIMLIHINVPLPVGQTVIHLGNAFILLMGLTFGGWRAGLGGGLGSALSDVFSGTYALYAPGTFIAKGLIGLICGKIAFAGGRQGKNMLWNTFAVFLGSLANVLLSPLNGFLVQLFSNNFQWKATLPAWGAETLASLSGTVPSILIALLLAPLLRKALDASGLYRRIA